MIEMLLIENDLKYRIIMKRVILNIKKVIIDKHLLIFFSCLFLLTCKLGMAQCIDFSNLNASYTQCYIGIHDDPCQTPCAPIPGRHEVLTTAVLDAQTNNNVMIDPGYVKLGNAETGSNAEGIRYTFTVTSSCELLKVDFIVVLQDHGHAKPDQAFFKIRILDSLGVNELSPNSPCDGLQIYPTGNPDFITMDQILEITDDSRYYTMNQIVFNLHQYRNRQITVEFTTSDCNLNEHFGYAYYKAALTSLSFQIHQNDSYWSVSTYPPNNFNGYNWNNGATTSATTYPITDSIFCCSINPTQPCEIMFCNQNPDPPSPPDPGHDTIHYYPVEINDYITDCKDSVFYWYLFDTTITLTIDHYTTIQYYKRGSPIDTIFYLHVSPYVQERVYEEIVCQSDGVYDSEIYGIHHDSLYVNMPPDTIYGHSQIYRCDSITIVKLKVIPPLRHGYIDCDTIVCEGTPHPYVVIDSSLIDNLQVNYNWIPKPGVTGNLSGRQGSIYIQPEAENPLELQMVRTTVCDTDTLSITIYHYPSYSFYEYDSVKVGHDYYWQGMHISPSYSVGVRNFPKHYMTEHGCDSSYYLNLTVYKPLTVAAQSIPPEICEGEEAVLYATGEFSGMSTVPCPPKPINIGDFICADDSIFSPSELGSRTPIGVIFYVNSSGWHGSAVSLIEPDNSIWGRDGIGLYQDISTLYNYNSNVPYYALQDVNGSSNTNAIRVAGNIWAYPAAYTLSAQPGWYFPALGQLCQLLHNSYIVNQSLMQIGAPVIESGEYWSSTEAQMNADGTKSQAWYMDKDSGLLNVATKEKYKKIRSIRDF